MSEGLELIGVDWGATTLRAWAFDSDGNVLESLNLKEGVLKAGDALQEKLLTHLTEWLGDVSATPIIACGAIGGQQGLGLAGYVPIPCLVSDVASQLVTSDRLCIVPGLQQVSPPDVMRGYETALFGLDDVSGAVCIPGLHSRHILTEHGRILQFTTEMTGEMHGILLREGGLRQPGNIEQSFDKKVFVDWVERSLNTEDATNPFSIRAARILGTLAPQYHACALSGLLIGAEVAAHYDPGDDVLLVADGHWETTYSLALAALGVTLETYSAEEATLDGLFELADTAGLLGEG